MVVPQAPVHPLFATKYNIGQAVGSESLTSTMAAALNMVESIVRDSMTNGESLTFKTASTPPDTWRVVDRLTQRDSEFAGEAREATQPSAPSPSQTRSRPEQVTTASAT